MDTKTEDDISFRSHCTLRYFVFVRESFHKVCLVKTNTCSNSSERTPWVKCVFNNAWSESSSIRHVIIEPVNKIIVHFVVQAPNVAKMYLRTPSFTKA